MPGLTTNEAPFIEQARREGQLYIHQPYELYSEENHEAWRRLYGRLLPRWGRYANEHFLAGIEQLRLDHDPLQGRLIAGDVGRHADEGRVRGRERALEKRVSNKRAGRQEAAVPGVG